MCDNARTLYMYFPALFRDVVRPRIPACCIVCEKKIKASTERGPTDSCIDLAVVLYCVLYLQHYASAINSLSTTVLESTTPGRLACLCVKTLTHHFRGLVRCGSHMFVILTVSSEHLSNRIMRSQRGRRAEKVKIMYCKGEGDSCPC